MTAVDLDRLVLGVLMASFDGTAVPAEMADLLAGGLGGLCLFGGNLAGEGGADPRARALADVVHDAHPECLVALDEEGGEVTRLDAATGSCVPGAAVLGAAGDPGLTAQVAAGLGRRLRAAGVDLVLAPVADVNVEAANPIIGSRSFGADPDLVAHHTGAAVQGMQSAGTAACVKHFPGHGAVTADSHDALPRVTADLATLWARELVPFAAAVEAGVAAVMTAHIAVPALGATGPATTSPAVHRLLRHELGFRGVVVSDALDMAGVSGPAAHRGVGQAAVAAVAAGVDLVCLGTAALERGLVEQARTALVAAVCDGQLAEERLGAAAARVRELGERMRARRAELSAAGSQGGGRDGDGGLRDPGGDFSGGDSPGGDFSGGDAGDRAARAALRRVGRLPDLRAAVVVRVVDRPTVAAGPVPWDLAGPLAALIPGVTGTDLVPGEAAVARTLAAAAGRPVVVLARDLDRSPAVRRAVAGLVAARPDAVVVDAGWPSTGLPDAAATVRTHGSSQPSLRAAAHLLAAGAGR
ncbi:MAG: glycoside hydrolase family 3 N-terminal domain-containing protein [Kineosporiaceae bacterium]